MRNRLNFVGEVPLVVPRACKHSVLQCHFQIEIHGGTHTATKHHNYFTKQHSFITVVTIIN